MATTTAPGKQRDELLSQLRATRDAMMSPPWLTRIRSATPDQRTASACASLKVQLAILDLETLKLEEIRDDIVANSAELEAATADLRSALTNLNRVATVLKAAGGFLDVVAKVVRLF